ncbi:hypothetical protein TUM20985_20610 [Mycobacterium antarcticum]|uniref:DUF732 domain-containing protein n=1 Tax=unclassified Mycolicibacterium TaxID=2636767 RepID=UPI00238F474C|nr:MULTISPECIES: DUF732 domain-containing protein [unclassified Mycolicibacterium]BDX31514.1 hypothetical protein TUM20985_20610 [Mycolicibacterium sp. TUM20985]GLP74861.1 hypothetical protein TUM20983_19710 [Mycolicibacterium sp. TUM20983]GLP80661.1 hypothetical protein TUM20984_20810 [Mycolicibacterium sp. TUM20984]
MKALLRNGLAAAFAAVALGAFAAAPAQADPDTDFANELHVYGIYGPKDYNAWIGKIQCKRLRTGLDANAAEAAVFLKTNLARGTSEQAIYQFLSAGINYYCPDQRPVVDNLAGVPQVTNAPVGAPLPAEQG